MLDGKVVLQLHQGKVVSRESDKLEGAWNAGDSILTISLPIDGGHALDIVSTDGGHVTRHRIYDRRETVDSVRAIPVAYSSFSLTSRVTG